MIKLRHSIGERDKARAIVEFIENQGRHIIENAPSIASEDKNLVDGAHARLGDDFAQLSQLIELTMNGPASAIAYDLISKIMLGSWVTGTGATYSPEAKKWRDLIKGRTANKGRTKKASIKNVDLTTAIQEEATSLGIAISISEECAKRLLPGVLVRCGKVPLSKSDKPARGFGWTAIRRQIQTILK